MKKMKKMNKMNKMLIILCVVILISSSTSCSTKPVTQQPDERHYTLKMSGTSPVVSETTDKVNEVLEKIKEQTDGAVEISFYPADQLGNYSVVYEEIMQGSIDMGLMSIPADFEQKLDINHMPYLVKNYEDARKVFAPGSFLFDTYEDLHDRLGVKLIGLYLEGFMGTAIGKSLKEIPEDIVDPRVSKDIQIRVPPSDVFRRIGEALGYRTTGIPWPDIYSSLQTGVVEGYIGAPALICYDAFRDVVKAYIPNNYMIESMGIIMNKELYENLPVEYQEIIDTNLKELAEWSVDYAKRSDLAALDKLRDFGIEVIEPTEEELKILSSHVRDEVWPSLRQIYGDEIMDGLICDVE